MDTKQLIHIGSELVLIAGISFYFNSQIVTLKRTNEALIAEINQIKQVLSGHENILRQGEMRPSPSHPSGPRKHRKPMKKQPDRVQEIDDEEEYSIPQLDHNLKELYDKLNLGKNDNSSLKETNGNIEIQENVEEKKEN